MKKVMKNEIKKTVTLLLGLGLTLSPLAYAEHLHDHETEHKQEAEHDHDHEEEHEHREHGAHVHGQMQLNIASEDNRVELSIESPLHNLLGFEYQPKTAEEKATFDNMLTQLNSGAAFVFEPQANCQLEEAHIQIGDHDADAFLTQGKTGHNDVIADYHFDCQNLPDAPNLSTRIFELFPQTHDVNINLLSEQGQRKIQLKADTDKLALDGNK